jgi:hypothetical protein
MRFLRTWRGGRRRSAGKMTIPVTVSEAVMPDYFEIIPEQEAKLANEFREDTDAWVRRGSRPQEA